MRKVFGLLVAMAFAFSVAGVSVASAADGETVFKKVCKSCHNVTAKKKVGPGLAGISKRPGISKEWAKAWIADPQGVWEKNEGYTATLKKAVKKENKSKTAMKIAKKKAAEYLDAAGVAAVTDYIWGL